MNQAATRASIAGPDSPDRVAGVLRACDPGTDRLQEWAASGRVYSRHDAGGDGPSVAAAGLPIVEVKRMRRSDYLDRTDILERRGNEWCPAGPAVGVNGYP